MEKSCCLAFWNTLNGNISIRGTLWLYRFIYHCERFEPSSHFISVKQDRPRECRTRGGSRGRVQGVCTLPWDYLRFSNTTGILQKNYVGYWCWSRARDECTPPKKNPGSAPENCLWQWLTFRLPVRYSTLESKWVVSRQLWYYTLVIDLIGQFSRDVIGRPSGKPWCHWLRRLVMSLVRLDPSIVTA